MIGFSMFCACGANLMFCCSCRVMGVGWFLMVFISFVFGQPSPDIACQNVTLSISSTVQHELSCEVNLIPADIEKVEWFAPNGSLVSHDRSIIFQSPHMLSSTGQYVFNVSARSATTAYQQFAYVFMEPYISVRATSQDRDRAPSRDVYMGETVILKCPKMGYPIPSVMWIRKTESEEIELDSSNSILVSETGVLTLLNVNKSDRADYRCILNNTVGYATIVTLVRVKAHTDVLYPVIGIAIEMILIGIITCIIRHKSKPSFDISVRYSVVKRSTITGEPVKNAFELEHLDARSLSN